MTKTKFFFYLSLSVTITCYGYLDPGTGSYLIQVLLAGFLGAAFGIKMFWKRITSAIQRIFNKEDK